jgi:hypothetical protein
MYLKREIAGYLEPILLYHQLSILSLEVNSMFCYSKTCPGDGLVAAYWDIEEY